MQSSSVVVLAYMQFYPGRNITDPWKRRNIQFSRFQVFGEELWKWCNKLQQINWTYAKTVHVFRFRQRIYNLFPKLRKFNNKVWGEKWFWFFAHFLWIIFLIVIPWKIIITLSLFPGCLLLNRYVQHAINQSCQMNWLWKHHNRIINSSRTNQTQYSLYSI